MGKEFNLMRWVVHGQNFVNAYHGMMRNQGAAGVDGMPTEALPQHLAHNWEGIKAKLLRGEYRPQPVRRRKRFSWPPQRAQAAGRS